MKDLRQKIWQGVVLRKAGVMTVVVEMEREWQRRPYDKKIKRSKRFMVHDPKEEAQIGQKVGFRECRPVSKRKRWVIVGIKTTNEQKETIKKDK